MFVKMIKSRRSEWRLISVICVLVFGFSIFLQCMVSLDTDKYIDVSTVFFMWIICFILFFISFGGTVVRQFNLYISMGGTRKTFIISMWLISAIKYVAVFLLAFVMHKIQNAVLPGRLFADIGFFFKSYACIIVIVMLPLIELLVGSLILRFGTKAYWVIWGIYMVLSMLPANIEKAMENKGDSLLKSFWLWALDIIPNITEMQIISIAAVAAVVFAGISSYIIMKQDVTA